MPVPFGHYEVPGSIFFPSFIYLLISFAFTSLICSSSPLAHPARPLCKWMCVCVRENSPPHLCLWVRKRTHLPSALPSNHTSDNLLANKILDGRTDGPGHTQEDTHYTEWYPLWTHPRGYPLHWVIPIPWVIFLLTESSHNPPKNLPITPRDLVFLTNKPDTEWYPWHWGVSLMTLRDTLDTEWYFLQRHVACFSLSVMNI